MEEKVNKKSSPFSAEKRLLLIVYQWRIEKKIDLRKWKGYTYTLTNNREIMRLGYGVICEIARYLDTPLQAQLKMV